MKKYNFIALLLVQASMYGMIKKGAIIATIFVAGYVITPKATQATKAKAQDQFDKTIDHWAKRYFSERD